MTDHLRELLYPLGFLSSLAFSARMLLQWLNSETQKKSIVMPAFWKISLCGNLLLLLHSFIQIQFHVCLIQTCHAIISWRNLNLMAPTNKKTTQQTIFLLLAAIITIFFCFTLQAYLFPKTANWFRIPTAPWQNHATKNIPFMWHIIGFCGLTLFSSRFWIQWYQAEKYKISHLSSSFWLCSLIGESLSLLYFIQIDDPVNFIGPAFGLIPYIRNLLLIAKNQKLAARE